MFDAISQAPSQADRVLQDCLPPLRRWVHGRFSTTARGGYDTQDLVQEAAARAWPHFRNQATVERDVLEAYLRVVIRNLVRDEIRRVSRRPSPAALPDPDTLRCPASSPWDRLVRHGTTRRCHGALRILPRQDRRLLLARFAGDRPYGRIAADFGLPSPDAARMAVGRALHRCRAVLTGGDVAVTTANAVLRR